MLGLSRHIYVLATNRQIPSWLGKLNRRFRTPHVAIAISAALAFGLVLPARRRASSAACYAFGATIAITIAHLSIIRMRITEPDRERPFRIPFDVPIARPPAAAAGAGRGGCSRRSPGSASLVYHDAARWVGGGWMLFGLLAYVVYRRGVEGTTLTERVEVPAEALVKEVLGRRVRAASSCRSSAPTRRRHRRHRRPARRRGRRAAASDPPALEVIYVVEMPLTLPLDAPPPPRRRERWPTGRSRARATSARSTRRSRSAPRSSAPARSAPGSSQAARERGVEVIVMGGEPPTPDPRRGAARRDRRRAARPRSGR